MLTCSSELDPFSRALGLGKRSAPRRKTRVGVCGRAHPSASGKMHAQVQKAAKKNSCSSTISRQAPLLTQGNQQNQSCWAAGISFSFSTINPLTSGGGGTYGINIEWTKGGGLAVFTYGTPNATPSQGLLLSAGASINGAVGKGPWSGLFNSTTGAYGPVSGGFFQSPPGGDNPGYFGLEAGAGPGLPGIGSTTTNYTPLIQLTHPTPNDCTGKP